MVFDPIITQKRNITRSILIYLKILQNYAIADVMAFATDLQEQRERIGKSIKFITKRSVNYYIIIT